MRAFMRRAGVLRALHEPRGGSVMGDTDRVTADTGVSIQALGFGID